MKKKIYYKDNEEVGYLYIKKGEKESEVTKTLPLSTLLNYKGTRIYLNLNMAQELTSIHIDIIKNLPSYHFLENINHMLFSMQSQKRKHVYYEGDDEKGYLYLPPHQNKMDIKKVIPLFTLLEYKTPSISLYLNTANELTAFYIDTRTLHVVHNGLTFKIEQDIPEVGVYLYVYQGKKCIHDYLQNDIRSCKKAAFEDYNVPMHLWNKT